MAHRADATRERTDRRPPGSRLKARLLLDADRPLVALALLAGLFAVVVLVGALDPVGLRRAVAASDPIETLFNALVPAIVTGVTLVVTINQLVLSQELGALGDQRGRMEGAMAFRRDVEDVLDEPASPPEPAAFLRALVEVTAERAATLDQAAEDVEDEGSRERLHEYVSDLRGEASRASDGLADARFGTFDVLRPALEFDYSQQIHRGRSLRGAAGVDDRTAGALSEVLEALELYGPAREHVKTLYFQWELIDLSRAVLYAAGPALAVAVSMVLFVSDPGTITGTVLGVDNLLWLVAAATTVSLAPFAILMAYVLRIATVAKRTLAIGPFVLGATDRRRR